MASTKVDPERVAAILLSAELLGDKGALAQWGISQSTLGNYRKHVKTRPEVAAAWEIKKSELADRLGVAFIGCMVSGLEKMQELIAGSKVEPGALREVTGAVKILGELHTVREMLIGKQSGPVGPSQGTPEAQKRDAGGTGVPTEPASEPVH